MDIIFYLKLLIIIRPTVTMTVETPQNAIEDLDELKTGWQPLAFLIMIILCAQLNCWVEDRRRRARRNNDRSRYYR